MLDEGFQIIPSLISDETIASLRLEADRLAQQSGTSCVRNIRAKSPLFHNLALQETLLDLLPSEMVPVRSILFDKNAIQNWPVAWHQDLTIAVCEQKEISHYGPWSSKDGVTHVQPPIHLLEKMITLRLHLDHTPLENGALQVIPKSHLAGRIPSDQIEPHLTTQPITCECQTGDLLLMKPLILHSSKRSQNPTRRRVLHFEYAPASALHPDLTWHEKTS